MMFMFCTACPAAPFTRLSMTESTTSVSPPCGLCTAMRQTLAARTERVSGWLPAGSTSPNGSAAYRSWYSLWQNESPDPHPSAPPPARAPGDARQPLPDFRPVSMAVHSIGLEVVRGPRKKQRGFAFPARARDAGLRVGNEMFQIDDTRLDQRQKTELHRRRIAAGVGGRERRLDTRSG